MAGEVRAMSMLCFMHYKGHVDATKDFLSAAKWCRKAADAGDPKKVTGKQPKTPLSRRT